MRVLFILVIWLGLVSVAFAQDERKSAELENFVVITDQDFYLAGDRLWFGGKLLKNHDSFRYSKLAYISLRDQEGNEILAEKMLLSDQDMVFGDFFLPENARSGVYSLVVYSKWMSGFADFPVAKKEFLVVNPKAPKVEGKPQVLVQTTPFANVPISLIHTSDQAELIEIQDENGQNLEILESVEPLKSFFIKPFSGAKAKVIFRNETFDLEAPSWFWDPSDFTLKGKNPNQSDFVVVTHTDWDLIEQKMLINGQTQFDRSGYSGIVNFDISVIDKNYDLVWTYRVKNPISATGQLLINSKGKVGESLKLDFAGIDLTAKDAFILASSEEHPLISGWMDVLNDPNWTILGEENSRNTLPLAINKLKGEEELLKDFSPMFNYQSWSVDFKTAFPSAVSSSNLSFTIPQEVLEEKVERKFYREYFGIAEEVIELESPFSPDKVYFIDDYDEFPDLETFVKQIIPQIKLRKSKDADWKEIRVANTDNQQVKFDKVPLVLIDFYRVASLEEVWSIDMASLDRVEIYYHRETVQKTNLGEEVGNGLIVLYTKNNEYALKKNLPKSRYFLSDVQVPRRPDYSSGGSLKISANPLQFLLPGLGFYRGRAKSTPVEFDTAGNWKVEGWVFGNGTYSKFEKSLTVDP